MKTNHAVFLAGLLCATSLSAAERLFPADAGFVNVKDPPYSARGDGVTDDTAALTAALKFAVDRSWVPAQKPFVYFPSGTYLVSETLESRFGTNGYSFGWRNDMSLLGQNETNTIIRLRDQAPGFGNLALPQPVLRTGSESNDLSFRIDGSGGSAHKHSIINLTVDTGAGNPGAVGIDYLANNQGVIKDVTIRSGDGQGYCGLLMTRYAPGPALVKRVRIEGFNIGISLAQCECSMTLEHITLIGQKEFGIYLRDNVLNIHDLTSSNSVPVAICRGNSQMTLVDGVFTGGAATYPAITNRGKVYLRNLTSSGYGKIVAALAGHGVDVPGGEGPIHVAEYMTMPAVSLFPSPPRGLHLPVEETPEFHTNDLSQWASVVAFGATPDHNANDDAVGIQAAIDSGKPVVYLPRGEYTVNRPIILRGAVRKFAGLHSYLGTNTAFPGGALIRFDGGGADTCIVEHLRLRGGIEHNASQTLVIRHLEVLNGGYRNTSNGTGRAFIEDIVGRPILVNYPQPLWARQLNPENGSAPLIENHGGAIWILGLKTEGPVTVLKNVEGFTEVLGALTYPTDDVPNNLPLVVNENGAVSFTWLVTEQIWPLYVRETRDGVTNTLVYQNSYHRGVPLYSGQADVLRLQRPRKKAPNLFEFEVSALPGTQYAIDRSEDCQGWRPVLTNTASGLPWNIVDLPAGVGDCRYYRARRISP